MKKMPVRHLFSDGVPSGERTKGREVSFSFRVSADDRKRCVLPVISGRQDQSVKAGRDFSVQLFRRKQDSVDACFFRHCVRFHLVSSFLSVYRIHLYGRGNQKYRYAEYCIPIFFLQGTCFISDPGQKVLHVCDKIDGIQASAVTELPAGEF